MDRGYLDFERLYTISQASAFFVIRAKSQVSEGLFPYGGQDDWPDLRSIRDAHRFLSSQRLSGQAAQGEVSRCRNRQNTGISDQQLHSASNDHYRVVPMPLAGRTVLQMDQAKPANQDLLRNFGKRSQSPNLDCRFDLRTRCHHEEAAQSRDQSLHNSTGFKRNHFRTNALIAGTYRFGLQKRC